MPGTVQSIERAAAILQVVAASHGTLGVTDIAEAVGLAKTTTHSLLRTLLLVGFVDQDRATGHYALGTGLLRLGSSHLDVNELRARSSNWADALASRSGQSVRLATLVGGQAVVVHHVFRPDDSAQVLDLGTALPAHSALGMVLQAFAVQRPAAAPRPPDGWREELAAVRSRGWAAERGEHAAGEGGLAAPVRGATGLVVGALGVSGPVTAVFDGRRQPRSSLVAMVTDAASAVSRELGHGG
ncbi:transcriptional regulator, IclR family [Modestobacter sp. DSM 44400]|uniref:IclR family transcriptional regulator n=1 Tax=Modestobacter sp. DSM 44400 TaxID=1550230 RepID=UPI0008966C04|nr:IclR family transcriptional regulator [Modestobacter sp. DSM 44400]SDY38209.1 transcriptional regulator, IclR family [Modestobacter sp. DSM 44400]